jgi:hypothetical protein
VERGVSSARAAHIAVFQNTIRVNPGDPSPIVNDPPVRTLATRARNVQDCVTSRRREYEPWSRLAES